jgi:hypothetical protein
MCRFLQPKKRNEVSVCVAYVHSVQSLELRLAEFIEYHRLIGVNHFVLYDRSGVYKEFITDHYPPEIVTHIYWPGIAQDRSILHKQFFGFYDQFTSLNHCLFLTRRTTKWVGMFDLDEWVSIPDRRDLRQLLDDEEKITPNIVELVMPRLEFKTGLTYNPSQLVIEQFTTVQIYPHRIPSYKFFIKPDLTPIVSIHYSAVLGQFGHVAKVLPQNLTTSPLVPRFHHYIDLYNRRSDLIESTANNTDLFFAIPAVRARINCMLAGPGDPVELDNCPT